MKFNSSPRCPVCGAETKEMSGGKGFRCVNGKVKKVGAKWITEGCAGVVWNNDRWTKKKAEVARPSTFPVLKNQTAEQTAILEWLSTAPRAGKSRFLQVNAGPGCGKTTTLAAGTANLLRRCGTLQEWAFLCFNTNARDVMLAKLPPAVANIHTLNSHGGQALGYQYKSYEPNKLYNIFGELTAGIERQERPRFGGISPIIERMRDLLLWADSPEAPEWRDLILLTLERFQGLAKAYTKNCDDINEFLPQVFCRAMAQSGKIDISEQVCKAAYDAMRATGWKMPAELTRRTAEWTDEHIRHFAKLVRSIKLPQQNLIVDEAQDMSLPILASVLAQTWQSKELVVIGDDREGERGSDNYQAGQGIYGWRGAGGGMFHIAARVWAELTGEEADQKPLNRSFRCSPAIVAAFQELNKPCVSARTDDTPSGAHCIPPALAFESFLAIPDNRTALWIARRNAPLAPVLLATIKAAKQVTLRGLNKLPEAVERVLTGCAKKVGSSFVTPLAEAMNKLQEEIEAMKAESPGETAETMEEFVYSIGQAIMADSSLLENAEIKERPSVNALLAFVRYYNDCKANRTISTVYRCKGDEADVVIIDDVEHFNKPWNGDDWELDAVRHVACSRPKNWLLLTGPITGIKTTPVDPEVLINTISGL